MLKEEGKLNYDDLVEKYFPDLPYKNITIRHLLTHTSGLPDYLEVMDQHWDKTKVAGNPECIGYLVKFAPPKHFEPGEKYEYSNTGYLLLASIAEKASGIDFISFSRTRIFVPLEMTSTDIRSQDQKKMLRNMAWPPTTPDDYNVWLGNRRGPGRISSTTSDLLKWDQALYKHKLVSDSTLKDAFTPMKENYGFGWVIVDTPKNGKLVWHNGSNPGYSTQIMRYIDRHKTVIVLCNNAHDQFNELVNGVAIISNQY
jgi:CubicO group peptidase (beta-lactamase class C family)